MGFGDLGCVAVFVSVGIGADDVNYATVVFGEVVLDRVIEIGFVSKIVYRSEERRVGKELLLIV